MKQKRIFTSIFMLCVVALIAWLGYLTTRPEVLPVGSAMPALAYTAASGKRVLSPENDTSSLIILFHPRCKHCIAQLHTLEKQTHLFSHAQLYLLTTDSAIFTSGLIAQFPNLMPAENVIWGTVSKSDVKSMLGSTATPQVFIFNGTGRLTHKIRGESKPDYILKKLGGPEHRAGGTN